jgi:hypothetical protein
MLGRHEAHENQYEEDFVVETSSISSMLKETLEFVMVVVIAMIMIFVVVPFVESYKTHEEPQMTLHEEDLFLDTNKVLRLQGWPWGSAILQVDKSEIPTGVLGAITEDSVEGGVTYYWWAKRRWSDFHFKWWEWDEFRSNVSDERLPRATKDQISEARANIVENRKFSKDNVEVLVSEIIRSLPDLSEEERDIKFQIARLEKMGLVMSDSEHLLAQKEHLLWQERLNNSKVLNLDLSEIPPAILRGIAQDSVRSGEAFFFWAKARWGDAYLFSAWEWHLFREKVKTSTSIPTATDAEIKKAQDDIIADKQSSQAIIEEVEYSLENY